MNDNLFKVDDIKVEMPNQTLSDNVAKIAVIGVGGGGCNMVNHMINEGTHKIDLISANTDMQVLHISKAPKNPTGNQAYKRFRCWNEARNW